ncbi:sensor histidine kinase [Corynebacterium liangguodongii]|uniref:histidine kinase n=1 Tax=Corynebacterium liangguodongii TaxID=2079535 RepID=A0A2S0WCV4_9CORY|nr:histidine kinase [Corynebacterium liangguodongii]AWB83574.1 two-component sensor histidine kinase [Corynebacterium liangguodongii]PWB98634.1 two-component sensor histidine kinase [Corynebacterium liangguodongii]
MLTAVAAALALLYVLVAVSTPTPVNILQALASAWFVPFFWVWRSRPVLSAAGFFVGLAAWSVSWFAALPANPGVAPWLVVAPMAVYASARHCTDRRAPGLVLALSLAGSFVSPAMWQLQESLELRYAAGTEAAFRLAFHWALLIAVYFAGTRGYAIERQREAEEKQRLAALRGAQEEERMLIARELHDALAHSLTLMKVQAAAGLVASKSDPEAAVGALEEIRQTSDEALTAVREIVHALRNSSAVARRVDLPGVIEGFRAAGLDIDARIPAELDASPELIQLAVSRIVTEAFTNVLRHQGVGARVIVEVTCGDCLAIDVASSGTAQADSRGSRTGLIGLEERARSLGGSFRAGGSPKSFRVHAELPL